MRFKLAILLVIFIFTISPLAAVASDNAAPSDGQSLAVSATNGQDAVAALGYGEYYNYSSTRNYTLIHEIIVKNDSRDIAYNVTIDVPLMDSYLPAYIDLEGETITPLYNEIITDAEGHRIARFTLPYLYGYSSLTISMRFIIDVYSLNYTFDRAHVASNYSQAELDVLHKYLQPRSGVSSNDQRIIDFAAAAVGSYSDIYQKAHAIFAAVNLQTDYSDELQDQSSIATLERGSASCQGYTNLYLAALRAEGIACRQQSGYLYVPSLHTTDQYIDPINGQIKLNSLRHTWVEFFVPSVGWVVADPTFTYTYEMNGITQKFVDWDYFANIAEARRYIFFREGALDDESINYVATGGRVVDPTFNSYLQLGSHWAGFKDIETHWAKDAINASVQKGLFTGIDSTTFAPNGGMTRAMFITVLGRMYELLQGDLPTTAANITFSDININDYYGKYLIWGVSTGIIEGYSAERFGPNDTITREQMAKMIMQFALAMGVTVEEGAAYTYADQADIAVWAKQPAVFCGIRGIITGMPGNLFAPKETATRAQVATILERILLIIEENSSN